MANPFKTRGFAVAPNPNMEPRDDSGVDVAEDAGIETAAPKNLFATRKRAEEQVPTALNPEDVPVADAPAASIGNTTAPSKAKTDDDNTLQALFKSREALTQEGINIRDNIEPGDRRKPLEDDWMNRWSEQNAAEREFQLSQTVTFDGAIDPSHKDRPQLLRRGEEVFQRLTGTAKAAYFNLKGDSESANAVVSAMNDLSEYNGLIDRNSVFGAFAGPLLGEIGTSLGQSSVAGLTGGALVVPGMFGLDSFNKGMEEAKDLDPKDQAIHATTKGGISFFTTFAGGMLAKKAGVANGETVIPLMSKVSKNIFSSAGLKEFAVKGSKAGFAEGMEEGVETLLSGFKDYQSGLRDNLDGLFDETLQAFTTGALVGNVTELATGGGLSPAMEHVSGVMKNTVNRLKKDKSSTESDKPAKAPRQNLVMDQDGKLSPKNEVKITPEGRTIHTADLDVELNTLVALEEEIQEQFESGGAKGLKQSLNERTEAFDQNELDLKDLRMERNKWINMVGKSEDSQKIKNIDNRMKILTDYKADLEQRIESDKAQLAEWDTEFKQIHADEMKFITDEYNRLAGLRELPNASEKILDKLSKPKPASKAKATKEGEAAPAKAGEADTESKPASDGQPDQKVPESDPVREKHLKEVEKLVKTRDEAKGKVSDVDMAAMDAAIAKKKAAGPQPRGNSVGSDKPIVDAFDSAMVRGRQRDQAKVREVLGLDKLPKRERQATEEAFNEAARRGLAEQALTLADEVVQDGRILDSVELAGVQQRYVGELQKMTALTKKIANEAETMSDKAYQAASLQLEDSLDTVNRLTEAWSQTASEAGAALQAQQRYYGVAFSPAASLVKGRRNKGEDLTTKEIESLTSTADDLIKASERLTNAEKGTREYDIADMRHSEALMEHVSAIKVLTPRGIFGKAVEAYNGIRMGLTLGGDLPPLFRQGFATMKTNPIQAAKNYKAFYKPFFTNSVEEMKLAEFKGQRALREMENFSILTKKYGVPISSEHTAFSDVEASGLQRMTQAVASPVVKAAGKAAELVDAVPVARQANLTKQRMEAGYRLWLNTTRLTMADIAYRANKELLTKPGGEKEMRQIIDNIMNATGHSVHNLGTPGSVFMTAPRWMLSRFEYPLKAVKHIPLGIIDTVKGNKSASRYIAKQYATALTSATLLSYGMEGIAALMFGPENVSVDRNPTSKTFGLMRINNWQFDVTGGMGFVMRAGNKLVRGAAEAYNGPDNERDADFGQSLGGILGNRTSPIIRDLAALYQSGKPMGDKEKSSLAEYVLRGTTFLSWQSTVDALRDQGLSQAAITFVMEMHGASGFPIDSKKKSKRSIR